MKKCIRGILLIGLLALPVLVASLASAEDSAVTKAKDDYGDAKTQTKKTVRQVKQIVRKKTNNDSIGKDAKDKVDDVSDSLSNSAAKAKRHLE